VRLHVTSLALGTDPMKNSTISTFIAEFQSGDLFGSMILLVFQVSEYIDHRRRNSLNKQIIKQLTCQLALANRVGAQILKHDWLTISRMMSSISVSEDVRKRRADVYVNNCSTP